MAANKKTGDKKQKIELLPRPITRLREFLQIFHDTDEYAPDSAFCFIIGSGASLTANIPTGASLVNRWLVEMHDMDDACQNRILPPHARIEDYADALLEGETERLKTWAERHLETLSGFKFEERAKFYGHIYKARFAGDPTLGQKFLRTLIHRRKPSIGFHLLARVLNRTRHNVVITTNFDHLVEDAIAITENEAVQSFNHTGLAGFIQSRARQPAVAKIHGDILLRSFNAADELENLSEPWKDALRTLFRTYTPVVIGYGGNDPGFMSFLLEEMKSWTKDRRCYWFVRQESSFYKIPSCVELADIPAIRIVECPGFTELMVKLDEVLNFVPLDVELKRRAEEIAKDLAAAHTKAKGEVAEHEHKLRQSRLLVAETEIEVLQGEGTLEVRQDFHPSTWQEWSEQIRFASGTKEKRRLISEALAQFPDNLPLRAAISAEELKDQPSDNSKIEAIREILLKMETLYGPQHPDTLAVLYSLGAAQWLSGQPGSAEVTSGRVIASRELVLGPEHPSTLQSRNLFANALNAQRKHMEGEQEHRVVLAIRERVLGPEHPDTLMSRNNLAIALNSQGKHAEAEQENRAILSIRERVLGPEHPDTLRGRNNLANVLNSQGKHAEAEKEHRAVLAIREHILETGHLDIFTSRYNLALTLENMGEFHEALDFAKVASEGFDKVLGRDHLDTQRSRRLVAILENSSLAATRSQGDGTPNPYSVG